ncbi:MAG: ATP-binding protein [Pseudomonadota bacterium]
MNMSLGNFFKRTSGATLDSCDREQIHLSGMIMNTGALLVIDPDKDRIVGASENIADFLSIPIDAVLGQPISAVAPDIAEELNGLTESTNIVHEILESQREVGNRVYDTVSHTHDGRRFVEFVLNESPSPSRARKRMRMSGPASAQIMAAPTLDEAMQIACDTVRAITGFARVKIYRFLPDWSGETTAESNDGSLPSYLGLHFPDSDIPKQVRALMEIVPYRFVGRVDDDNIAIRAADAGAGQIDLTWAMNRSVSAMHTAYLRNIGAGSSFSCSLMDKGKLWGLIACHTRVPAVVPADSWSLVQEIGTALMLKYDQTERTATADMIGRLRRIENEFAAEMRRTGDVEDVIKTLVPILQKFLRADGFAFQFGNTLHTSGAVPPEEFIRKLVVWSKANMEELDQFQTAALHAELPEAVEHMETACGVLVQPIVMHRVCQLLWFRGPITRQVEWAGRPKAKVLVDPKTGATLGPRHSFDKWVEEHRDQSLPWQEAELEAAREIFKEFLDIMTSQLLLKEENSSLRKFAHTAAHDIQSSLRGISAALSWMEEDGFEAKSTREHQELALEQAKKLQHLTHSLLEISLLQDQKPVFQTVDLTEIVEEAHKMISHDLASAGGRIEFGTLPEWRVVPDLMTRLILNLCGNAIKYGVSDDPLEIAIEGGITQKGDLRLTVTDNGPGIEARYAEKIFEQATRLQSEGEGSGFGLAICAEIAKNHDGHLRLDTGYTDGARFVFEMPRTAHA